MAPGLRTNPTAGGQRLHVLRSLFVGFGAIDPRSGTQPRESQEHARSGLHQCGACTCPSLSALHPPASGRCCPPTGAREVPEAPGGLPRLSLRRTAPSERPAAAHLELAGDGAARRATELPWLARPSLPGGASRAEPVAPGGLASSAAAGVGQLGTPLLTLHPFFHELDVAHPQAIKEVINCLQQRFYSPTQDIFVASSIAKCMYVIAKGMASYAKEANFLSPKRRPDVRVAVGQHVAEGGLWLENWAHLGTLTVAGLEDGCCEVLSLDSLSFGTLLRRGPCELWQAASSYARAFARRASDGISDLDADTEGLMKITDEAFADALRFLAQEAGRDCGEGAGPVSP
ncbi:unnamed protein product [Effrenium voratum]|nr:unnamed protein product [Effrenium voratum]